MNRRLLIVATATAGTLFLAMAVYFERSPEPTQPDEAAHRWVEDWYAGHMPRWGDDAREVFVDDILIAGIDAGLVLLVIRQRGTRLGLPLGASMLALWLFVRVAKEFVDRVRPPGATATSDAFPSAHVATYSLAVFLFLLVVRPALGPRAGPRGLAIALAIFVPPAVAALRVTAGAHWVTDTIGSTALAVAWAGATRLALDARLREAPTRQSPSLNPPPDVRRA